MVQYFSISYLCYFYKSTLFGILSFDEKKFRWLILEIIYVIPKIQYELDQFRMICRRRCIHRKHKNHIEAFDLQYT